MNLNPYTIYKKIKKHGIKKSVRIIDFNVRYRTGKWAWVIVKPVFYKNLFSLMFGFRKRRKRLLGIWDWAALPWSVGDPMMFIEDLNILKEKNGYDIVDICVVFDLKYPDRSIRITNLTPENGQSYAMDFLPLFTMCSGLGTVHLFNDRKELHDFIEKNIDSYEFYPSLPDHLGQKFNYSRGASIDLMLSFHKENGYIPPLNVSYREQVWAANFFKEYVPENKIPVTVSLKNTTHGTERNANLDLWYDFFKLCNKKRTEVQFILVGLKNEADPRILKLDNVIFAKDYGTSLIQDIALVDCSAMYMGPTSGISTSILFSDTPYIITKFELSEYKRLNIKTDENIPFATKGQKIFPVGAKLTGDLLFEEFCVLFDSVNKSSWREKQLSLNKEYFEHPSAKIKNRGNR